MSITTSNNGINNGPINSDRTPLIKNTKTTSTPLTKKIVSISTRIFEKVSHWRNENPTISRKLATEVVLLTLIPSGVVEGVIRAFLFIPCLIVALVSTILLCCCEDSEQREARIAFLMNLSAMGAASSITTSVQAIAGLKDNFSTDPLESGAKDYLYTDNEQK